MTVDTAIARFRRRQQDLFRDELTVTRTVGEPEWDINTGEPLHTTTVTYIGSGLVRAQNWQGTKTMYGGDPVTVGDTFARFPPDADVDYGDTITVTASTYDEALVGRTFRVIRPLRDGWQIARKCIVEEITTERAS